MLPAEQGCHNGPFLRGRTGADSALSPCGPETCGADEPCVEYSLGNRLYGTVYAGASGGDSGTGRGVECEYAGGRATNVTPAVRFIVEKVKNGVKVMLKGKPETEQVIPFAALKQSIGKAAVAYVEKFIGDRATVGNKQGSLGNRLRAVLKTR